MDCDPPVENQCPHVVHGTLRSILEHNFYYDSNMPCFPQVYVNNVEMKPTIQLGDLIITTTDITVLVNASDIKAEILVSNLAVSVKLPFSYFRNNTEGHCGEYRSEISWHKMIIINEFVFICWNFTRSSISNLCLNVYLFIQII